MFYYLGHYGQVGALLLTPCSVSECKRASWKDLRVLVILSHISLRCKTDMRHVSLSDMVRPHCGYLVFGLVDMDSRDQFLSGTLSL